MLPLANLRRYGLASVGAAWWTAAFLGAMTLAEDNPVPAPPGRTPTPKAETPPPPVRKGETPPPAADVAPPKEKPRTPSTSEHIPPVKIGAELETTPDGVLVRKVADGSAADEAGMQPGDLIVKVAGSQVLTPIAIDRRFHHYRAGQKLEVVALRKGREVKMMVELPKTHEPALIDQPEEERPTKVTVLRPEIVTPAAAPQLVMGWELQEKDNRVWIASVAEGSLAGVAGLRKGDLIVGIDQTPITSGRALASYLASLGPNDHAVLAVERGTRAMTIEVVMPATHRAAGATTAVSTESLHAELLARLKVQEELMAKLLAEIQALRAELKPRP